MLFQLSDHAKIEREERLLFILTEIGVGERIICKIEGQSPDREEALTDNGILLVLVKQSNLVITAYVPDIDKVTAIWRALHGEKRMPQSLYKQVLINQKTCRKAGY